MWRGHCQHHLPHFPLGCVRCWCWDTCLYQLLFLIFEHTSGLGGLRIGSKHRMSLRGTDVLSMKERKQALACVTERKNVSESICNGFGHYSCFFPPPCFCCLTLVPAKSTRHVRHKLILSALLLKYPLIHHSLVVTQPAWGHLWTNTERFAEGLHTKLEKECIGSYIRNSLLLLPSAEIISAARYQNFSQMSCRDKVLKKYHCG